MAGETVKTFSCPNCGGAIKIFLPGETVTVACESCTAVMKPDSKQAGIVQTAHKKSSLKPEIPFGTKGNLWGTTWMCIGLVVKEELKWKFKWKEYLLYNPKEGFAWLTEGDGNWTFVRTLTKVPKGTVDDSPFFKGHPAVCHQGRNFRIYHSGRAAVNYVLGEFYWKITVGDTVKFSDYVRSGEMITMETEENEVVYSHGVYVAADEVAKAFKLQTITQPYKVAAHEPSDSLDNWVKIRYLWWTFSGIVLLCFMISVATSEDAPVVEVGNSSGLTAAPGGSKLGEFTLPATQNLEFKMSAPVNNNWTELNYTLVNKQTGDSMDFDQGVEYYTGRDSDGSWAEGSQSHSKIVSAVPEGTYELLAEQVNPTAGSYGVKVYRNVAMYSNFVWTMILLGLFPLFYFWRMYSDLARKWEESDFTPFTSSDGDDGEDE